MPRLIHLPTGDVVDVSPELAATLGPGWTPESVDEPADVNPNPTTPDNEEESDE